MDIADLRVHSSLSVRSNPVATPAPRTTKPRNWASGFFWSTRVWIGTGRVGSGLEVKGLGRVGSPILQTRVARTDPTQTITQTKFQFFFLPSHKISLISSNVNEHPSHAF